MDISFNRIDVFIILSLSLLSWTLLHYSHIIQQGSCGQKPVLDKDLFALSIIFSVDAQAGAAVGGQIVPCRSTFIGCSWETFHMRN
jgi:hypothetical protein